MLSGPLLGVALKLADLVARALPRGAAYAVADVTGAAWHRFAPDRRALVRANLERVCAATGRPTSGSAFRRLVRRAFVAHARYYLELLRAPHYPLAEVDRMVEVDDWPTFEKALRSGPTVLVSAHLGNFEPFGSYLAAKGFRAVAPVEEIEPRVLYEFLRDRRGSGRGVDVVPLSDSRRPMMAALRRGGVVGLIADRDLSGDGLPVTFFGHLTSAPLGPATLAVLTNATLIVGRSLRIGPERFTVSGEMIEWRASGNRRDDIEALTRRMVERMEHDIAEAPDQWFGAFQPFWKETTA